MELITTEKTFYWRQYSNLCKTDFSFFIREWFSPLFLNPRLRSIIAKSLQFWNLMENTYFNKYNYIAFISHNSLDSKKKNLLSMFVFSFLSPIILFLLLLVSFFFEQQMFFYMYFIILKASYVFKFQCCLELFQNHSHLHFHCYFLHHDISVSKCAQEC